VYKSQALASAGAAALPDAARRDPHWSQNRAAEPAIAPHARHRTGCLLLFLAEQ
jgi:hypothetical protein